MRWFLGLALSFLFFAAFLPGAARASVVRVDSSGGIYWNVLSYQNGDSSRDLNITYLANGSSGSEGEVSLTRDGEKVFLQVTRSGVTSQADVSGVTTDIVEIEEREGPEKIRILLADGQFRLYHKGVVAGTEYPIAIDTHEQEFLVNTPTGRKTLFVLPFEAISVLTRARIMTVHDDGGVDLVEDEDGGLEYIVRGQKNYGISRYLQFSAPVVSRVSAVTGEVVDVDRPLWLSVIGGLLG